MKVTHRVLFLGINELKILHTCHSHSAIKVEDISSYLLIPTRRLVDEKGKIAHISVTHSSQEIFLSCLN